MKFNKWVNSGFSLLLIIILIFIFMVVFSNSKYKSKEGFVINDLDEILDNIKEISKIVEEDKDIDLDSKKELLKMINADDYSIFSSYNLLVVEIKNNNGTIKKTFLNNFNKILHERFEKKLDSIVITPEYKKKIKMFIKRIDDNIKQLFSGCNEWSDDCR